MFRGERWTDILNWSCKGSSDERCGCDENIEEIHYVESSGRNLRKTVAVREWKCGRNVVGVLVHERRELDVSAEDYDLGEEREVFVCPEAWHRPLLAR
jgi:hypothetical protein